MQTRYGKIAVLAIVGLIGAAVGAAITFSIGLSGFGYASATRHVADVTMDTAILEKMSAGDNDGAKSLLLVRLKASMLGLDAGLDDLTPKQRQDAEILKKRADEILESAN